MYDDFNRLIDLTFKGTKGEVKLDFLHFLLQNSKKNWSNSPLMDSQMNTYEEIVSFLNNSDDVDLGFSSAIIKMNEIIVENVFVNCLLLGRKLELFLFFDLASIDKNNRERAISILYNWCIDFNNQNNFNYFDCRPENGGECDILFKSILD